MADSGKQEFPADAGQAKPEKADPGVVADVTEKAKDVAAVIGEAAVQARDKAQELAAAAAEQVGAAKDKVQGWATTATDQAGTAVKGAGRELTALVRRYPVPALLIGFGLGFLLARVTRR